MQKLVVLNGSQRGTEIAIGQASVTIGRSTECTLQLDDKLCSRKHCCVSSKGDKVFIQDLDSSHGLFVARRKITGREPLPPESKILIGHTMLVLRESGEPTELPPIEAVDREAKEMFQRFKAEDEKRKLYEKEQQKKKDKQREQRQAKSLERTKKHLGILKYLVVVVSMLIALKLALLSETLMGRFLALPLLILALAVGKTLQKKK